MDSADLLLTKPGGLTISEVAVMGLPMLLMDVVGGYETKNLKHSTNTGLEQTAATPDGIVSRFVDMIQNADALHQNAEALKKAFPPFSAQRICDVLS